MVIRPIPSVAFFAALLFFSMSPTYGWWEYAKWGMTIEELNTASGGKVQLCNMREPICRPRYDGYVPNYYASHLTVFGLPAGAAFCFDDSERLERTVIVFDQPGPTVDSLLKSLQSSYGPPAKVGGGPIRFTTWRDTEDNTSIVLLDMSPIYATIEYKPLSKQ